MPGPWAHLVYRHSSRVTKDLGWGDGFGEWWQTSHLLSYMSVYLSSSMSTSCRSLWYLSHSLYLVLVWAALLCWRVFQGSAPPISHQPLQEISTYSCSSATILVCHSTSGWWASWRCLRIGEHTSEVRLCVNVLCRLCGHLLDQGFTKLLCLDTNSNSNCFWGLLA